jgi:hypothetical protein
MCIAEWTVMDIDPIQDCDLLLRVASGTAHSSTESEKVESLLPKGRRIQSQRFSGRAAGLVGALW